MREYRLLEITTQYDKYLRQFYKKLGNADNLSYEELSSLFAEDGFAEANFLHIQLKKLGIESAIIYYNNRTLQNKWNTSSKENSYFEILLSQVRSFAPDVIMISDICAFSTEQTAAIKECISNKQIKLVGYYFVSIDNNFLSRSGLYDHIYTGSTYSVESMRKHGIKSFLLRHAFEPHILNVISSTQNQNKICFCGNIFIGEAFHNNRLDMLDAFDNAGLPYVFYGDIIGNPELNMACPEEKRKKYQDIIQRVNAIKKESLYGIDYYSALRQYNVCINIHINSIDKNSAGNMRMYEVTGVGSCLLTDHRNENSELFEIDKEITVYKSMEDMVEKAKWLLDHPTQTREIGFAGQKHTLSKHTYRNKAEQLNEYIQILLK